LCSSDTAGAVFLAPAVSLGAPDHAFPAIFGHPLLSVRFLVVRSALINDIAAGNAQIRPGIIFPVAIFEPGREDLTFVVRAELSGMSPSRREKLAG